MRICVLTYIVLLSIAFQSLSALAGSVNSDEISTKHASQTHQHHDNNNTLNTLEKEVANQSDCHNCGHCHGSHAQWLANWHDEHQFSLLPDNNFQYLSLLIEGSASQLLRPPKV